MVRSGFVFERVVLVARVTHRFRKLLEAHLRRGARDWAADAWLGDHECLARRGDEHDEGAANGHGMRFALELRLRSFSFPATRGRWLTPTRPPVPRRSVVSLLAWLTATVDRRVSSVVDR